MVHSPERIRRLTLLAATATMGIGALPAHAIDRIELEIGSLAAPAVGAAGIRVELALPREAPATATVQISSVDAGELVGALKDMSVECGELIVREPRFACPQARVSARGGPTGALAFRGHADYRSDAGAFTFAASGLALADGRVSLEGRFGESRWSVDADLGSLKLSGLRALAARWVELPATLTAEAGIGGRVRASGGAATATLVNVDLSTNDLNFTNEEGTLVAEKVAAELAGTVRLLRDGPIIDARLSSKAGQALAGPVLLDFGVNPLRLDVKGALNGEWIALKETSLELQGLVDARGEAEIALRPAFAIRTARLTVGQLRFPAAYTSFMQLALAGTDFGTLETSGAISGALEIAANQLERLEARLVDLDLEDTKGKFSMHDVRGAVHWGRDPKTSTAASHLEWSSGSAYGLSGGASRVDFRASGLEFQLSRPARLPIFDGALRVRSLAARKIGTPQAELDFDAVIEPISMPLLSQAFGWPEMSGRLSGSIPGLTYRNRVLSVQGDVQAQVFDGTITGRNFRLQDPLGPWPRLFADITARSLDLALVTRTFSIGSITGRLDGDIQRLELFSWSPIAFDARLSSTPNDRSPHRISQKAVTSISSIGSGGGGGVAKTLQSGVLRFFDEFNYDRIGIACRLRNEVCLMSGIDRQGIGYYIVKGRGIPRIDIIGSTGRVDWPQLVSQIVAGMRSEGVQFR
ncbi:MAG: hypothetical protein ACT4O5_09200 [Gammaproteobacteria bacterium]